MRTPTDCPKCGKYFMYSFENDSHLERDQSNENPFPELAEEQSEIGLEFMRTFSVICPECHEKENIGKSEFVKDEPRRQCCTSKSELEMTMEEHESWDDKMEYIFNVQ